MSTSIFKPFLAKLIFNNDDNRVILDIFQQYPENLTRNMVEIMFEERRGRQVRFQTLQNQYWNLTHQGTSTSFVSPIQQIAQETRTSLYDGI